MARLTLVVALLVALVAAAHVNAQENNVVGPRLLPGRKMLQQYGIRADFVPALAPAFAPAYAPVEGPAYKDAPVGFTALGRRLQQAYGIRSGEAPAYAPAYKDADVVSP